MPLWKTALLWLVFTFRAVLKVAKLHFTNGFDVIHCHNLPDFLICVGLVPKLSGAKLILHIQDLTPELMAVKATGITRVFACGLSIWQERLSTMLADHVVTVGAPFETPLLRRGVPQTKLSSILNSADPGLFQPNPTKFIRSEPPTAEFPLIFMYHGTCAHRNGVDIAVRAFAKASTEVVHMRLHLKVRQGAIERIRPLVESLGVSEKVCFSTPGTMEEVVDFIEGGDVGIIPYRSDGFMDLVLPTKSYEFALMRKPMIASDMVGIRSIFGPNSIKYCHPSKVDEFAEAMVELYRHPEELPRLVESAAEEYKRVRWEIMAERYRKLLSSLASEKLHTSAVERGASKEHRAEA